MTTMPATVALEICNCSCGGVYAITEAFRESARQHGRKWLCPYCRGEWSFGQSEADRQAALRKNAEAQLARERAAFDQERAKLKEAIATKESQRRAEKAAKTRLKKRAAAGVCPCCNRTVRQLAAHMATKHPEFVAEAKAE